MFSSSGRDTSSWVHTEEHGKGQSLVSHNTPLQPTQYQLVGAEGQETWAG